MKYRKNRRSFRLPLAFLLFFFCAAACWMEISSISGEASRAELEHLQKALERSAVHCYAVKGTYPESLDDLKEHYGITWDESKYVVDYTVFASNLRPSITVIPLRKQEVTP